MPIEEPPCLARTSSAAEPDSAPLLKHRRVLVLTNDRSLVRSLRDLLQPEGCELADVRSSGAMLDRYADLDPDLLLLDVDEPDVRAPEICRYLKNAYGGRAVATILIASDPEPAEIVAGLAAGAVDFLFRPWREAEVLARLRVHLLNRLRLAQLSREDQAKNRLLCMAAHDLRNPLVSIRALTHLLRAGAAGPVPPSQRELLDTVFEASQSMLELVNDLLDASVLEAGEVTLTPRPTVLADLLAATVRLGNATAAQKGSCIVLEPGPLPPIVSLDAPKVRQVLNNLLGNALKFSPPGSTVTVRTALTADHCLVAVRDQGPGIRESERARLFKDFSRTSVRPTGGESSTGLGLSICQRIMEAHAGSIRVDNLPGGGAEFTLVFPLDP